MPLVSRTRAILRSAEFGFFGVTVATRVQTPRRWGAATCFLRPCPDLRPGVVIFFFFRVRPLRTSWFVFGTAGNGRGHQSATSSKASTRHLLASAAAGGTFIGAIALATLSRTLLASGPV